jgi:repressor LexA
MKELTKRQQQVVDFINKHLQAHGMPPSLRDIAKAFKFRSMTSAVDHIKALRKKGVLETMPNRARALRVISPLEHLKSKVSDIPIFGTIPAGLAQDKQQEALGCVSIDVETLGMKPTPRTFALEVRGESMVGKHILNGDIAIIEHGVTPRSGDVVAALIDNESTLKTFVMERSKPYLRAENPRYPNLIPAQELVIQGVMMALIRKRKK